ncbi:hypothetical protein [uncultured Roseobacter sp.]|uniref:hypothetical protein n=1 Tax=uncultured Roseobacter sp. TaxID=114847 RepID=UPI002620F73C|nr:hypothetical protein [uncultured Roseobacter sp.]
MIRPEARETLWRWREVLAGMAAALLGLWWLAGPGRLLVLPAIALLVAGAALIWIGVQRARFRTVGAGPGSVDVDEGQVTYFGPLTGGTVALREMRRLALDGTVFPAHWRLEQPGQPALMIPVNAEGADMLFDAFATLPGLRTAQLLRALEHPANDQIVIWQRDVAISAQGSVH